jgi:hypothetical protein
LCEEFGFDESAAKFSESLLPTGLKKTENADARGRIAALEEKAKQHDSAIAVLQNKFTQLSTDFGRFSGKVSALPSATAGMRTLFGEVSSLKAQIAEPLSIRRGDSECCNHITSCVNYRQERSNWPKRSASRRTVTESF